MKPEAPLRRLTYVLRSAAEARSLPAHIDGIHEAAAWTEQLTTTWVSWLCSDSPPESTGTGVSGAHQPRAADRLVQATAQE